MTGRAVTKHVGLVVGTWHSMRDRCQTYFKGSLEATSRLHALDVTITRDENRDPSILTIQL